MSVGSGGRTGLARRAAFPGRIGSGHRNTLKSPIELIESLRESVKSEACAKVHPKTTFALNWCRPERRSDLASLRAEALLSILGWSRTGMS